MLASKSKPWLFIILGPTAVGKTELSIRLAEKINAEIISADSRLFYRGMDIGTAKPTPQELSRVPHHLIDIADPDEVWSLGRFQKKAMEIISDIYVRGAVPLCVGGTGQYIRAISEGWQIPKLSENKQIRAALRDWTKEIGNQGLFDRLKSIDPQAVEKIDPRNVRRTIRALEVIFITGKKFSEQRTHAPLPYQVFQIGLTRPKEELFERIDLRVDQMIGAGFLEEVRSLLLKYPPDLRSFSAIGYKQLIDHLEGHVSFEEAVEEIKRQTKKFVRRQYTWFKPSDPNIHWFMMEEGVFDEIFSTIDKIFF